MKTCIIVDDEPLARQLLEGYISQLPDLQCLASCQSAVEAFAVLHRQPVDLMFLDIQMPGITGLNFARSLKHPPQIIFTTVYVEHAVDAFELEALDYLLKPVTFERFIKAVQKVFRHERPQQPSPTPPSGNENAYLFIKVDRRLIKLNHDEIIFIEGLGDYVKVHTASRVYVTYVTLTKLEQLLPASRFIRIHRSTIINTDHIQFIEGNYVKTAGHELVIGQTYKEALLQRFSNQS